MDTLIILLVLLLLLIILAITSSRWGYDSRESFNRQEQERHTDRSFTHHI